MLACCLVAFPAHAAPEHHAWCDALDRRLRSVDAASCRKRAFLPGAFRSVEGRPLMLLDVPPALPIASAALAFSPPAARVRWKAPAMSAAPPGKSRRIPRGATRILLIGGIHGDELTSVSIVFRWMEWLAEAEAQRHHWRIAPLANPDGLLAQPARRTNGRGVDLNRNFSTPDWPHDALNYWRKRTGQDPRRYPGKSAMSEPETRWLQGEIESFKPDVIVSVHAPYGILDYDGPLQKPRRFGRLNLSQLGVYPGSLGNFGGVHKNIPVITIELSHARVMPSVQEQRQIWNDMLHWIRRSLRTGDRGQRTED
ncbi:MAG: succinylglutamate desuccinylase/aspartoacylase family protein [Zoogloeaceae bacterium]|nr:succinylglutamate desuccinylase/aspartoacylase family protein [Zoogloeaceae bacterium]